MKSFNKIFVITLAIGNFVYAGGDILPSVFEREEEVAVPVEEYVPPVAQEVVEQPIVAATPQPVPVKPLENIVPLGLYVGLGLVAAAYDPKCSCTGGEGSRDKTAGVVGRVGYDFNKFVGVEARGIRTNWKSDGGKIKHYGAFLKPMYPVTNDVNVYGLAGYAKTKTEGSLRLTDAESFAWGAGVEYDLAKDVAKEGRYSRSFDGYGDQEGGWGFFADYERLVQKSGSPDLDTISAGITYDF